MLYLINFKVDGNLCTVICARTQTQTGQTHTMKTDAKKQQQLHYVIIKWPKLLLNNDPLTTECFQGLKFKRKYLLLEKFVVA